MQVQPNNLSSLSQQVHAPFHAALRPLFWRPLERSYMPLAAIVSCHTRGTRTEHLQSASAQGILRLECSRPRRPPERQHLTAHDVAGRKARLLRASPSMRRAWTGCTPRQSPARPRAKSPVAYTSVCVRTSPGGSVRVSPRKRLYLVRPQLRRASRPGRWTQASCTRSCAVAGCRMSDSTALSWPSKVGIRERAGRA